MYVTRGILTNFSHFLFFSYRSDKYTFQFLNSPSIEFSVNYCLLWRCTQIIFAISQNFSQFDVEFLTDLENKAEFLSSSAFVIVVTFSSIFAQESRRFGVFCKRLRIFAYVQLILLNSNSS